MGNDLWENSVLLYDGVCGLCNRSVQFVLEHDRRCSLRFAPLQSEYGQAAILRHPDLKNIDSVVLLEITGDGKERIHTRSAAALRIASYLGGFWRLFSIAYIIPAPLRNFLYDLVARYRYRLFGKYDQCMLPPPEVRSRFIGI